MLQQPSISQNILQFQSSYLIYITAFCKYHSGSIQEINALIIGWIK